MRRVLPIFAIVSLLLAVLVVWTTPVQYLADEYLWRFSDGSYIGVASHRNYVEVLHSNYVSPYSPGEEDPKPATHRFLHLQYGVDLSGIPPQSIWNRLGFYDLIGMQLILQNDEQMRYRHGFMPRWYLVAILALPSLSWACRAWIARLRRNDPTPRCPGCGYDLRGTPDRCPECGLATVRPTTD